MGPHRFDKNVSVKCVSTALIALTDSIASHVQRYRMNAFHYLTSGSYAQLTESGCTRFITQIAGEAIRHEQINIRFGLANPKKTVKPARGWGLLAGGLRKFWVSRVIGSGANSG